MLDKAAIDHIKLMADPCEGRLVPAAYPTPGGGAIQRFRAVVALGTGAGETSGIFHWIPGENEYFANGAATPTTNFTPGALSVFPGLSYTPGTGNSAVLFRCAAACLRVITNASEMNRSGVVYGGQTQSNYFAFNVGSSTNVSTSVSGLPVSARMPAKHLEILWVPSAIDHTFDSDNSGLGTTITADPNGGRSAITFGFVGAPAASGVTLELTAVYEIQYNANGNVVSQPSPVTPMPWSSILSGFYKFINNSPVIIDTVRKGVEYMGVAASSQPGRLVAGAARLALAM